MVSGSVKGLKSEDVAVIDSQGRLLSGEGGSGVATGASTVHDYKERVEQGLARKAEEMLAMVLGPGRATVQVSAVVDMNSVSTIKEIYDPASRVPTSEEVTTNSETGAPGAADANGSEKKDKVIKTEYEVGKTVTQETILPGEIKSLSVAAFVDLSVPDSNDPGTGGQPALLMQVTEVEEIIRSALGLKLTDSLKVVHAKFQRQTEALVEEEASVWPRYLALARQLSLGIMAVCAVLVFRIFSRARTRAAAAQAERLGEGSAEGNTALAPGGPAADPLMLRRQITHELKSNPEQVRAMFLSWIEEKE